MAQKDRPLHPKVAQALADQCIARMEAHHRALSKLDPSQRALSKLDPSQRAQRIVEQATFAEIELCNLVGAIGGEALEQRLRALFWPALPQIWTAGPHILDEAIAAAGASR